MIFSIVLSLTENLKIMSSLGSGDSFEFLIFLSDGYWSGNWKWLKSHFQLKIMDMNHISSELDFKF